VKFERFDQRHIAIAGPVRGNVMVNSTRPESFGSKPTIDDENNMDTTDGDTPERRTIALFDVEATKRVEAELDAFINKRSREREEANRTEELWAEQE
jgi:hypothetical protein